MSGKRSKKKTAADKRKAAEQRAKRRHHKHKSAKCVVKIATQSTKVRVNKTDVLVGKYLVAECPVSIDREKGIVCFIGETVGLPDASCTPLDYIDGLLSMAAIWLRMNKPEQAKEIYSNAQQIAEILNINIQKFRVVERLAMDMGPFR